MRFRFHANPTIPRCSWLAQLRKGEPVVDLFHGSSVETGEEFFVEGAWDARFTDAGFVDAVTLLGSGGKIAADQSIVFAAPSHIYERLYALDGGDELFVSNSLVFLLARSGDELDPEHGEYPHALYRSYGVTESTRSIPTRSGQPVRLFYYQNLVVQADLTIRTVAKTAAGEFEDFDSYRRFLESSVVNVFENASDSNRTVVYHKPIASISSGYDSTASAVFARKIGCERALTFKEARPLDIDGYTGGDDRGTPIANALGMTCKEFDRLDYLKQSTLEFPEAEIFVTSHLVDLNFLSLEDSLDESSIFFTGNRGDVVWNKRLNPNQDSGGPGMAEFRLRVGFVHFPVPYLGTTDCRPAQCRVSKSIRRISNSREMAPWSVGGDYDRPIPRRILEEAGVERAAFGQENKAVAVWFGKEAPQDIMTPASYRDFQDFRRNVKGSEINRAILWGISKVKSRYEL